MDTLQAKSRKKFHDIDPTGNWVLTYTVKNSMGPSAFGGKHLGLYKSPFDGSKVYRRSVDDRPLTGFMIDKLAIKLFPDTNLDHKLLIIWLICHPEVQLEGIKKGALDSRILEAKTGTKITLKCKDFIEFEKINDEDYIDKLIGRLSLDGGKHSIGIDKLRQIMAALNMSYRDNRFTGEAEKKALRSKLKTFTRKSMSNAKLVYKAIDNLENSKDIYLFKEMINHNIIEDFGGTYKYNNVPLGSSFEKVQAFFANHPEIKTEALFDLNKFLE